MDPEPIWTIWKRKIFLVPPGGAAEGEGVLPPPQAAESKGR